MANGSRGVDWGLRRSAGAAASLWIVACLLIDGLIADEPLAFFEQRIRPVLVEHCYECHSRQAESPKGGFRLDERESMLRGGDSGPAIVAGRPDESLLIEAVRYESLEMPPRGKLPERVIANLVKWVEMGAPDPREGPTAPGDSLPATDGRNHWAFQPLRDPPPAHGT